jgi:hypothetical protein
MYSSCCNPEALLLWGACLGKLSSADYPNFTYIVASIQLENASSV